VYELLDDPKLFVGFKIDSLTLRELRSLEAADTKYVSEEDATFLTIVKRGKQHFVGKILEEPLTTDRVEDVQRNVQSILQRVLPDKRLPAKMDILPWREAPTPEPASPESSERFEHGRRW